MRILQPSAVRKLSCGIGHLLSAAFSPQALDPDGMGSRQENATAKKIERLRIGHPKPPGSCFNMSASDNSLHAVSYLVSWE